MLGCVYVNNIRCYAYHGCMREEAIIGSHYSVCVELMLDVSRAAASDNIEDTVDYVSVSKLVQEEMMIRSRLIEHVSQRILSKLMFCFPKIESAKVTLTKHNAPIGGEVQEVKITLTSKRL